MRECVQDRMVMSTPCMIYSCQEHFVSEGMCTRPDGGVDSMRDFVLSGAVYE